MNESIDSYTNNYYKYSSLKGNKGATVDDNATEGPGNSSVEAACGGGSGGSSTISSCEGCVFTNDSGSLMKDEKVPKDVTVVDDYSSLGNNFYGIIITNIFICGIYNNNNNPFCLEGGDSSKYGHNVEMLNEIYGDSCADPDASFSSCGSVELQDSGYIAIDGDNGYYCVTDGGYGYYGSGC